VGGRAAVGACVALAVTLALGVSGARAAASPAVSDLTGTLLAAGPISGQAYMSFSVSDAVGLREAALIVGSTTVDSMPLDGTSATAALEFDTATVPDGFHELAVTVTDESGVTTIAWQGAAETFNAPLGGVPQINGATQVGETLVASDGTWSPAATSYSYQWLRCDPDGSSCAPLAGATTASYAIAAGDAYDQLEVAVTATDTGGSTTATSAPSGPIADADGYRSPPPAPALAAGEAPQVTGSPVEGQTLAAQPGSWSSGPIAYAYQWQRCDAAGGGCASIAGATGATYALGAADLGATLRVLVGASGPGGTTQAASPPTAAVTAAGAASAPAGATATTVASCRTPALRARLGAGASETVPFGRAVTLRGTLRCGPRAIAGAAVELTIAPLDAGGATRHALVRTGAGGAFRYVLGPGTSRRVSLAYRRQPGTAAPAAQATATLLVRPSITLRITPAATSNGHTITFTGAVAGGHEPAGGLTLEIEYREGSAWMIYTTVRTVAGGAFVWRYTFHRTTESITYWFRVAIPAGGVVGYPYLPAASPPRSVHVTP